MASNDADDFGINAYLDIQAELEQWGEPSPVKTPRKSPGLAATRRYYGDDHGTPMSSTASPAGGATDRTPASSARGQRSNAMEEDDGLSTSSLRSPNLEGVGRQGGPVGVQTPAGAIDDTSNEQEEDDYNNVMENQEQLMGDGVDSYRPYHDALFTYLQTRERLSKVLEHQSANSADNSMMQIDGDDDAMDDEHAQAQAALDDAEMKFLDSLASVCLLRGRVSDAAVSDKNNVLAEASKNEGNLWDLLSALRLGGLSSLFYCVNGEEIPDLILSNDPASMVESAPADVLEACLGGDGASSSLPLQRLTAALGWIEGCHGRKFEDALKREYEGSDDPILPPPRRRTMWPGTVAALQQKGRGALGTFHPDAPRQSAFGNNGRTSSPVDVSSFLTPEDEIDDARLLRACFMLFQAGRIEEAIRLVTDCGQPWLATSWMGGEPLTSDGGGNPTRSLWKSQCRKISKQMAQLANTEASSMVDDTGARGLYPSSAYEAAILSLLSDNVDTALANPVFQTWEDGVHAILRSEVGIIEDDVLRSHNSARVETAEANGGHFPYPGTEFNSLDDGNATRGNDGDLGAALERLEASPIERIREGGSDPFRNGMASFLVGQNALKEYMEECGSLSLEADSEDEACFLRFITHLVLYVDTALPEFSSKLSLPVGIDAATDGSIFSLRELLILKYVAYLSSRRELWPHVALYTSLLSNENILETFSSFLIHVHTDQERKMTLNQARDFFPKGLDCYILRNVVRGMIMCDTADWAREAGEAAAPGGVSPAYARMMRSIHWMCYYPEHMPDALVCANMLLRRFFLDSVENNTNDTSGQGLYAPKVFIEKILPKDILDVAMDQCQNWDDTIAGSISTSLMQDLKAEYLSIEAYLKAHTKYVQFLDTISKTSPCHSSNKLVNAAQSKHETEIADKMERNAFRQKKMGLCKIIVESSTRASEALTEVLTFAGGWLIDANQNLDDEETNTDEAKERNEEMKAIRSSFVPRAVFMLHEVLDKTAMWLEQIVYDTLAQFGNASQDMLLTLFSSFDETYHSNDDELTIDLLTTSRAAPGCWHKKALSLASIVANDSNGLHETFNNKEMEDFLKLMAESHYKLKRCSTECLFDV